MSARFCEIHAALIEAAGGTLLTSSQRGKLFVTKPGIVLPYQKRVFQDEFNGVLDVLRVDREASVPAQFAEFLSRLTYLSRGKGQDGEAYVRKVAVQMGHSGITGLESEPILFAGISDEILKELLSHEHGEVIPARVGRLTSANTSAMEDTLYVVSPKEGFRQREISFIEQFLELREGFLRNSPAIEGSDSYQKEHLGRLNLGIKAISVTLSMSTMNWKWLFMGRLKRDGNEEEIRRIAAEACSLLHERYPNAISHPRDYGYDLEL